MPCLTQPCQYKIHWPQGAQIQNASRRRATIMSKRKCIPQCIQALCETESHWPMDPTWYRYPMGCRLWFLLFAVSISHRIFQHSILQWAIVMWLNISHRPSRKCQTTSIPVQMFPTKIQKRLTKKCLVICPEEDIAFISNFCGSKCMQLFYPAMCNVCLLSTPCCHETELV